MFRVRLPGTQLEVCGGGGGGGCRRGDGGRMQVSDQSEPAPLLKSTPRRGLSTNPKLPRQLQLLGQAYLQKTPSNTLLKNYLCLINNTQTHFHPINIFQCRFVVRIFF